MRKARLVLVSASIVAAFIAPSVAVHADETSRPSKSTRLTATVSPRWIAPGDSAVVSGTLLFHALPYAGQPVKLAVRTPGTGKGFVVDQGDKTADNGTVAFTVTPERRSIYRLVFPGNAEAHRRISHRVAVRIKLPTTLVIAAADTGRGPVIAGQLLGHRHGLAGRQVELQARGGSGWEAAAAKATNRHGRVAFSVETGVYRLHFDGTRRCLPSTSSTVSID